MARQLRIEYPGAIYHVMNRGDRREPIFYDDADRRRFVVTLEQYLEQRRAQEDGGDSSASGGAGVWAGKPSGRNCWSRRGRLPEKAVCRI